jgi:hypothetical protein
MRDQPGYELTLTMDHLQLRCFYLTIAKAHSRWAGGEPYEQELLKQLRDETWKLLLEAQFEG